MNLPEHYDTLYRTSIEKIRSGQYQLDPLIDSAEDDRMGLTLLLRPDKQTKQQIQAFLSELRAIDPAQYYYPDSDIHVTVMSIIPCYSGFELGQISVPDYVELIRKSIPAHSRIEISFKGITASPSCVMVQGFLSDNTLNHLRDNLRANFRDSDLEQSIDKRYAIQTAHATVARFRAPLRDTEAYLRVLEKYRNHDFSTFTVDTLELVHNDWYQREQFVQRLHRFNLG
ncbi:2'-5' RNA ligase family protein [Pontibacter anaerobius]|uniref:Mutarotase n=1 Tax=Pontibacter anaerobius TaxID=2993940 RepID=A0ABT3RHU2_9BACT|nr:mutarotase [Pontibacter anaerobius]MCX2741177.1 mutarotase [Pontibacter anaerobius]